MLDIKSIPAFNDNYIWLIKNSDHRCALVDPGDATPVLNYLNRHGLTLETILLTHHHNDHVGGVSELARAFPKITIIGPKNDPVPPLTHSVGQGDQFTLFDQVFTVAELPGHTLGHIAYIGDAKVFCGDVLFAAGCGRVFEGTMEQMYHSLQVLASLPSETQVYCAHEYTASNVAFALAVEPNNQDLQVYREEVNRLRAQNRPTLPTTIGKEKAINPFLRVNEANVISAVNTRTQKTDPIAIFTALREWKNEF